MVGHLGAESQEERGRLLMAKGRTMFPPTVPMARAGALVPSRAVSTITPPAHRPSTGEAMRSSKVQSAPMRSQFESARMWRRGKEDTSTTTSAEGGKARGRRVPPASAIALPRPLASRPAAWLTVSGY